MKKSRVMCLNNFGPCRFLGLFLEFQKIKSSPKTGVSQITKYFNINPILTSHNYIQKIIGAWLVFVKLSYLHKQESYAALKIYCASDDITRLWRHYPIWRYCLQVPGSTLLWTVACNDLTIWRWNLLLIGCFLRYQALIGYFLHRCLVLHCAGQLYATIWPSGDWTRLSLVVF